MDTPKTTPITPVYNKRKRKTRKILYFVFLLVAVTIAVVWWIKENKYIVTDDANIASILLNSSSPASGVLHKMYFQEGQNFFIDDTLFEVLPMGGVKGSSPVYVLSPVNGNIAKKWLVAGDLVQLGQTVYSLNKTGDLWVNVFIEENKFSEVFMGQEAEMKLPAYKDVIIRGKIFYIGNNTASEFSLIPPTNASGNYTKVTQRIPIKISIDSIENKKGNTTYVRILSGMSVQVKIIKKKSS